SVTAADFALLRPYKLSVSEPVSLTLRTRLTMNPVGEFVVDELAATVAGSSVHGKLGFGLGSPVRIGGRLDVDTVSAPAVLATGFGLPIRSMNPGETHPWPSETFGSRILDGLAGNIDFTIDRTQLNSALVMQKVRGRLKLNNSE